MNDTMSTAAVMAVSLIVMGFVLFVLSVVMLLNLDFMRSFQNNTTAYFVEASTADVEAIANYRGDLPAATIYVALSKNPGVIEQINGTAYGVTVDDIEDLQQLFKYQIHVTVLKNSIQETYRITISQ